MLKIPDVKAVNSLRPMTQLDDDVERGLLLAVANGQQRLAMEYVIRVIADLQQKVEALEEAKIGKTTTRKSD